MAYQSQSQSYQPNMPAAARRHIEAADTLFSGSRRDVAGYLYGIAAECAVKAMMLDAGMRPSGEIRDDPFLTHFPKLRTMLRDAPPLGRSATVLLALVGDDRFLRNWDTRMRYCKASEIRDDWILAWKEQARRAVDSIGT